jgi:pimeloyl-ACP methyl ester carboxylesterase/ribosomal protein S18 acetylase RimI-like enzyme
MPFVVVRGRSLEYAWHGPPAAAAPTLVFLHEGLGSVAGWREFPARLAAATGCGALVYSRLGYGRSDPLPGPLAPSFMHEEALVTLPELLARLAVQAPILVGHSDGGSIALIHAGAGHAVRGLIVEAPHLFVEPESVESIARLRERIADPGLRGRFAGQHGSNTEALLSAWTGVWSSPEFSDWNIEASARGVSCPVLAIQGDADEYGTLRQVEAVRSLVRGPAELVVLPGCGHSPHRERAEETLAAMTAFVRAVLRSEAREVVERRSAAALRPMTPGDVPVLWDIFERTAAEGATYVQEAGTTEAEFVAYWCGRGGEQWVAMVDGAVVGGFTLRANHVGRGSHVATASYIVGAQARGRGVGRALCELSIERGRALGFAAMQFNCVVSTNVEAIGLWRRCGFEIVGTLPRAFAHRTLGRVDAYVMMRSLE